jgi:uncharacterized iron-regulated membrane protein
LRKVLFWLHLSAGAFAGIVILIMSVTGVLLMYERQMIAWADREYRSTSNGGARLPVETLLEKVGESQGGALPAALSLHSDPSAPAEASFGRERTVFVDVYSGAVLGEGSRGIRTFFRVLTDWHRWLGAQGENRAAGRTITGICNLAFLFLVMSGFYLWFPRRWGWPQVRAMMFFRGGLSGKTRDFNWHNVIGFWSAVPLFLIVLGGVLISFPWATSLLYRIAGDDPPAAARGSRNGGGTEALTISDLKGLNQAWTRAEQHVDAWKTITLRLPASASAPLTFSIDQAHRGRPDKRSQLTINWRNGEIRYEAFADYNTGRKIRTWLRWIHTGEAGGLLGQTLAGLVSAGSAVLVWTGIALALRRFVAWRSRTRARARELVGV